MAVTATNPRGSWSEWNLADLAECIDIAFAKVLADEFGRLTAGMSSEQIDNWLQRSEQSILLAYTLIKDAAGDNRLTGAGRLQVADFGAGCLAMQFGLAPAVADALQSGDDIAGVWPDAIDTGRPLRTTHPLPTCPDASPPAAGPVPPSAAAGCPAG